MSVLSDIYIAHDNEALAYDTTPTKFPERAQFKGITPLELSTLWAIIRDLEWNPDSMDDFACLLQLENDERLIHAFPTAMLTALTQLTPDQIRRIAAKWAATDELNCPPTEIQPIVEAMVRLARSAIASNRNLYLWNCV